MRIIGLVPALRDFGNVNPGLKVRCRFDAGLMPRWSLPVPVHTQERKHQTIRDGPSVVC
jgi:hypothetical protein